MSGAELLTALVIDPEAKTRSTLHGLLKNDQLYKNIVYKGITVASSFEEARNINSEENPFDVYFISAKFPFEQIATFIAGNKLNDPYGGRCHIIVSNEVSAHDSMVVAQGIAIGANSFLIFPCSVEKLRELTTIAQKMKIEATERMIEASLKILIDNLLKEIKSKVEMLYDKDFFTKYSEQLKMAAVFLLKDNQRTWGRYVEILSERTLKGTPKLILPKERLPRSKLLQEKLKKRMQKSQASR